MALYQGLQQKLQQKLSPQQIQLMKLLQVPTALLEERLKEEIEENPALEIGEEKTGETDEDASDELDLDLPEGEDEPTDEMEDPLQYEDYGDDDDIEATKNKLVKVINQLKEKNFEEVVNINLNSSAIGTETDKEKIFLPKKFFRDSLISMELYLEKIHFKLDGLENNYKNKINNIFSVFSII